MSHHKPENLKKVLQAYSKKVEPYIKKCLTEDVYKDFKGLALHQVLTGGKRLRPALAILSCQMLGGKIKDVIYPAAGLEILHNYSLIVDDLIDNGLLRRNQPTTWAKYGRSIAESVAFYYSASIFQAANRSRKNQKVARVFAQTIKNLANGEILDILFERQGRKDEPFVVAKRLKIISQKQYLYMVAKKTASLLEASCYVGGLSAHASIRQTALLKSFGFNLGVAFQIKDDLLDLFSSQEKLGKKIGKDIEERKGGNIVLLCAIQDLRQSENKQIQTIMKKNKIFQKDISKVLGLLKKTNAQQTAEALGKKYIKKAKASLAKLPQNKYNQTLADLADFVFSRYS